MFLCIGRDVCMITRNGKPVVLVFFDGFDRLARPGLCGRIASDFHFYTRRVKRKIVGRQAHSGFYVAFNSLMESLRHIGCEVRLNDFTFAQKHPDYPICMAGYPSIFDHVQLPNPVLFGPGGYGMPEDSAKFKDDLQFVRLMQPSDWFADLYKPYCGDKVWAWYAGIDTDAIEDFSAQEKQYDCLIYDKIRWHRDTRVPSVLDKITAHLDGQGRSYKVIRYRTHTHPFYLQSLRESKTMIFVCEHETQGLAYQEALAAGLPVLAWDEGEIVDPEFKPYHLDGMEVSSVPYFDERCGERFKIDKFETVFDQFWDKRDTYQPRAYVKECLSMEVAAKRYLDEYSKFVG